MATEADADMFADPIDYLIADCVYDDDLHTTCIREKLMILKTEAATEAETVTEAATEAETVTEAATEAEAALSQIVEARASYSVAISHAADMGSILAARYCDPFITAAELKEVGETCQSARSAISTRKGVYMERVIAGLHAAEAQAAKAQAEAEAAGKAATTNPAFKDIATAYARYAESVADKVEAFKKLLTDPVLGFDLCMM